MEGIYSASSPFIFAFSSTQDCLQPSVYCSFQSSAAYLPHSSTLPYIVTSILPQLFYRILPQPLYFNLLRSIASASLSTLHPLLFKMALLPPEPEALREDYTLERVREGIDYANQRMDSTNRPSPNLAKLLATYKSACQDFLIRSGCETGFEEWSKTALLREIQTYEENMSILHYFLNSDDEETQSFKASLLKLRRYQYYARYGDYARNLAGKLRITACAEEAEDWELLSREHPWKILSEKLKEEQPIYKKYGLSKKIDKIQTTRFVRFACMTLGADFVQMKEAIFTCGDREHALCSNVGNLLEIGEYSKLAQMISEDLNDLSSIFPLELKHEETIIRAILLQLKERWFEIEQDDHPFYPPASSWEPTKKLKNEHIIHRHPVTKNAAKAHTKQMVVRLARRRLRELKMAKDLAVVENPPYPSSSSSSSSSSPRKQSRKQSRHTTFCLRKRTAAWHAITSSARHRDPFNSSLVMQRVVNTVVSSLERNEEDGVIAGLPLYAVESAPVTPPFTPATSVSSGDDG